ncbi:MAG: OmpA family protein [Hyphomicrobiaceae bacterium]
MKCNPWRWLWGLIPVLMLGWVAIVGERGRIESDLTSRTRTVLERNGLGWADVKFEGRDAVISGRAMDEGEPAKAVTAVLDTLGVRTVDNRAGLVDKVDRFEWAAIRRDKRVSLQGLVPSEKARRDVVALVKSNLPGLEVEDRMKLARGAPALDVWLGGVGFALKQLGSLQEGRAELEQTSLSLRGDAIDARSYREVKAALSGRMPQGIRLKSESVRPPVAAPYLWSARRQGRDVVLAGHVPSDAVASELLRAAQRQAPQAKIVDRMEPASGAPEGFVGVASALVEQLGRLDEGAGQVRDRVASLSGIAETAAQAADVKGAMGRGVLATFRTSGEIKHREPPIKTITPYETSAVSRPGELVLSGYVPDERARATVLGMARERFPGRRVRDELALGAGQPQGWEQCLEAGLDALRKLAGGSAALSGRRLRISGTTDAEPVAQALPAEVRARAGAACDSDVQVTLDLAALQARDEASRRDEIERQKREEMARLDAERARADEERRRQEQVARLSAEEEQRRQAEAEARQRAEIEARQRADEDRRRQEQAARLKNEEEQRRRADAEARQRADEDRRRQEQAARLKNEEEQRRRADAEARQRAEAEARQRAEAEARQRADEDRRRQEAQRMAAASTERSTGEDQRKRQETVDVCQQAMSRVAREGIINFKRASFDLDPASYPTLNRLAEAVNQCSQVTVEIEGHTDAEGTPERNQRLSDRRANAVKDYLTRAGVEEGRLVAIGYGQDRNIAPNDTAEGRAKNRRIEFLVKMR